MYTQQKNSLHTTSYTHAHTLLYPRNSIEKKTGGKLVFNKVNPFDISEVSVL